MNIFYLDEDPRTCAQYHVDSHVVKMVLESAQMLSTAHWILDGPPTGPCYKPTHVNHPCAIWVRQSRSNYEWLFELMIELDLERQHRFTPVRGKTVRELGEFLSKPPANLSDRGFTSIAQAMPDELRCVDPIHAYRSYYMRDKRHLAKWTNRGAPRWWR